MWIDFSSAPDRKKARGLITVDSQVEAYFAMPLAVQNEEIALLLKVVQKRVFFGGEVNGR